MYLWLEARISTQNDVQYIAKACRYNVSKNQKNLSGERWFQMLQIGGEGFANYISGSQTATNMGHGLTRRETLGLKHIMG